MSLCQHGYTLNFDCPECPCPCGSGASSACTCQADEPADLCSNPGGHEWIYTGTAYGGDDERYLGEGRCLCRHCGADGDG